MKKEMEGAKTRLSTEMLIEQNAGVERIKLEELIITEN
jgi:hypothetical protein